MKSPLKKTARMFIPKSKTDKAISLPNIMHPYRVTYQNNPQ